MIMLMTNHWDLLNKDLISSTADLRFKHTQKEIFHDSLGPIR